MKVRPSWATSCRLQWDVTDAVGGRGGVSYGKSHALDDLWRFTIASRTWTQLNTTGPTPLPRFLFSYDIFYPALQRDLGQTQPPESDMPADSGQAGYSNVSEPSSVDQSLPTMGATGSRPTGPAASAVPELKGVADIGQRQSGAELVVSGEGSSAERSVMDEGSKGAAGSMIVFGGESIAGCYLNDVWVLHLNSLMWEQLSKPVACQKRCRSIIHGRA